MRCKLPSTGDFRNIDTRMQGSTGGSAGLLLALSYSSILRSLSYIFFYHVRIVLFIGGLLVLESLRSLVRHRRTRVSIQHATSSRQTRSAWLSSHDLEGPRCPNLQNIFHGENLADQVACVMRRIGQELSRCCKLAGRPCCQTVITGIMERESKMLTVLADSDTPSDGNSYNV